MMPRSSVRQQSIKTVLAFLHRVAEDSCDDIFLQEMGADPVLPTLLDDLTEEDEQWAVLLDEEDDLLKIWALLEGNRYLMPRSPQRPTSHFDLACLMDLGDDVFKQTLRTEKSSFLYLYETIRVHPVFHHAPHHPQLPVCQQLAITLQRLGQHGNDASIGQFGRAYRVSRGSIVNSCNRVITAILDREAWSIKWPNAEMRNRNSAVMALEGFPGCIGFVDGTTIPVYQKPGIDSEVFFDRKHSYSINCQIVCNYDKRIIGLYSGWPGSCADITVYKRMALSRNPHLYFSPGEYLLSDSSYVPGPEIVPAYRGLAARDGPNRDFNYCVAKVRIRNEHTIGILKGRWACLQGIRLQLYEHDHIKSHVRWITACCVLHNLLSDLGDSWEELAYEDRNRSERAAADFAMYLAESQMDASNFRDQVRNHAVTYNYMSGRLPIPGNSVHPNLA